MYPGVQQRSSWVALTVVILVSSVFSFCWGHEIPNERVDRSIQVIVQGDGLRIEYEVGLAEITLVRDLKRLIGTIPKSQEAWLDRYGQELLPLLARGFHVQSADQTWPVAPAGVSWILEEHPLYRFSFEVAMHQSLDVLTEFEDRNFSESYGMSRLGIRAEDGIAILVDDLPGEVSQIPFQPAWMLSEAELLRTRRASWVVDAISFPSQLSRVDLPSEFPKDFTTVIQDSADQPNTRESISSPRQQAFTRGRLTDLFHSSRSWPWFGLVVLAVLFGAIHAIQPGHGKTLIFATSLARRSQSTRWDSLILASMTTLSHLSVILGICWILWLTGNSRYSLIHQTICQILGLILTLIGCWKLGRCLGEGESQSRSAAVVSAMQRNPLSQSRRAGLVRDQVLKVSWRSSPWLLGLAAGVIPCWDALALLMIAEASDQLVGGTILVVSFSMGLGLVLGIVAITAGRLGSSRWLHQWKRPLEWTAAIMILGIGIGLLGGWSLAE